MIAHTGSGLFQAGGSATGPSQRCGAPAIPNFGVLLYLALHCGKAHVQIQWETLTPSKSLKFFKFELDVHDYVHEIYTSANFHFDPFSGASFQIGEILRFCDFLPTWLVIPYFFSGTRPDRTRRWICIVYGSYDVSSPKDGPLGVATISEIIWR